MNADTLFEVKADIEVEISRLESVRRSAKPVVHEPLTAAIAHLGRAVSALRDAVKEQSFIDAEIAFRNRATTA